MIMNETFISVLSNTNDYIRDDAVERKVEWKITAETFSSDTMANVDQLS